MSSSSQAPESWISAFCSLTGHEYFAEVSEDFIEDDFNLTGLQSQVPMYKEALEMILDVEPEEASDEDEDDDDEDEEDEDEMADGVRGGYRRSADAAAAAAERRQLRMASDMNQIEASAETLYGLIHQRFITSRPGIQQMAEKYEMGHFGHCPRVYCHGAKVLPVGCSDIPAQETVKLFCPSCLDVYSPPNSRFQTVDGAYFGTTFGCLFFMTFPELDVSGQKPPATPSEASASTSSPLASNSNNTATSANKDWRASTASSTQTPVAIIPPQPENINGIAPRNLAPGLGQGSIYEPRIYGFRVSEIAKTGPRMKWLRQRPIDINELDECGIWARQHQESSSAATAQTRSRSTADGQSHQPQQQPPQLSPLDEDMPDENAALDEGEVEDGDMAGINSPPVQVQQQPLPPRPTATQPQQQRQLIADAEVEAAEFVRDATARRKKSARRRATHDSASGATAAGLGINGDGTGGKAVRVGEGG